MLQIKSRADLWRVLMLHPGAFVEIPELEFEIGADHKRRVDSVYNHVGASIFNLGAFYLTLVPVRPRSRGERRSLRTFNPGVSLSPHLGFNPRPIRYLSTPLLTPFNSTPTSNLRASRGTDRRRCGRPRGVADLFHVTL